MCDFLLYKNYCKILLLVEVLYQYNGMSDAVGALNMGATFNVSLSFTVKTHKIMFYDYIE